MNVGCLTWFLAPFFRKPMNPLVFDPHAKVAMPEIGADHPRSELPIKYPNNGFNGRPIASIRFLLPSFLNLYGEWIQWPQGKGRSRTQFEVGDWLITIDRLFEADQVYQKIRSSGEHEWTHQGQFQRKDGTEFTWGQADEFLNYLYHLFSFACASPRSPQELIALDREGKLLFYKDESSNLLGDPKLLSWFPEGFDNPFIKLGPGLKAIWDDPDLKEVAIFVISVLFESNRERCLKEFKFVLAQTALELLANTIAVEAWSTCQPRDMAEVKIKRLLQGLKIDTSLPTTLPDLLAEGGSRSTNYPGEANWTEGPKAITQIRNMVTHADAQKRRKLFGLDDNAKFEAALLSLHYVEMVALWLFGYDGPVATRIDLPQILGKHIPTPWPAGGTRPGVAAP